jgi:hypothetical protein
MGPMSPIRPIRPIEPYELQGSSPFTEPSPNQHHPRNSSASG